jgi:hypothetical protein
MLQRRFELDFDAATEVLDQLQTLGLDRLRTLGARRGIYS